LIVCFTSLNVPLNPNFFLKKKRKRKKKTEVTSYN
jgi:hypothetical protein